MWQTRTLIGIVILTTLLISHWRAYLTGHNSGVTVTEQAWQAERLATAQAQMAELEKARKAQEAMQAQVDKIKRESANEKRRIAAQYERTIAGLRQRPERPSTTDVPQSADAGTGPAGWCTGRELYRPDSEFLLGEAARADQLRIALKSCLAAYNSARREVNGESP